jgi:hypothetical protein
MKLIKTCRNCRYNIVDNTNERYDRCAKNILRGRPTYCQIVFDNTGVFNSCTPMKLVDWEPQPTIREQFVNFWKSILGKNEKKL